MEIKLDNARIKAISAIAGIGGATQPSYASFLHIYFDDMLHFEATDSRVWGKYDLPLAGNTTFDLCISANKFKSVIETYKDEQEIVLSISNKRVQIKCGNRVSNFVVSSHVFPGFPVIADSKDVSIEWDKFASLVRKSYYASAPKEDVSAIGGVLIRVKSGVVSMTATDGTMAVINFEELITPESCEVVVPSSALQHIAKIMKKSDNVVMRFSENHFVVSSGDFSVCSTLMPTAFPDVSGRVSSMNFDNSVSIFDLKSVIGIMKYMLLFNKWIDMDYEFSSAENSTATLSIITHNNENIETGSDRINLSGLRGIPISGVFDASIIMDCLRALDSVGYSSVRFSFSTGKVPIMLIDSVIDGVPDSKFRAIIMPNAAKTAKSY